MAEISNRAVATAAAGAVLAVGLAFVGKADAADDRAVRCNRETARSVELVARSSDGAVFRKARPAPQRRGRQAQRAAYLRIEVPSVWPKRSTPAV